MKFKNLIFTGVMLLSCSIMRLRAGNTYYIATNGNDSNSGSINSPWRNLGYAIKVAKAGDTILMRGGNYTTDEVWIRGNRGMGGANGQYLTIKNYPGETVSLGGRRRIIIDANYLRFEGLNFRLDYNITGGGVGIQIVNNKFIGSQPDYGAIETGGEEILIEGNHIEITDAGKGNTRDHGIYLHCSKNAVIRNNFISGTVGYNIHIYDENKDDDEASEKRRYENILVENNFLTGSRERCGLIIASHDPNIEIDGVIVRNNVIANNNGLGILIKYEPLNNVSILNNTIHGNSGGIGIYTAVNNLIIMNNIFSANTQSQIEIEGNIPKATVSHNLYHQPKSVGNGVKDNHPIYGDPLFLNAAGGNFHLQKGSPAIDAGIKVGLPYIGAAPDLGAFEYKVNK